MPPKQCPNCYLPSSRCRCNKEVGTTNINVEALSHVNHADETFNGNLIERGAWVPNTYVCIVCGLSAARCECRLHPLFKNIEGTLTPVDPLGKNAHEPGAKLDGGKLRPALVLSAFSRALEAVVRIGTDGATKYTDNGWLEVPEGQSRYEDAKVRHQLARYTGQLIDSDSGSLHLAHEAWNALAVLELYLRNEEEKENGKD